MSDATTEHTTWILTLLLCFTGPGIEGVSPQGVTWEFGNTNLGLNFRARKLQLHPDHRHTNSEFNSSVDSGIRKFRTQTFIKRLVYVTPYVKRLVYALQSATP